MWFLKVFLIENKSFSNSLDSKTLPGANILYENSIVFDIEQTCFRSLSYLTKTNEITIWKSHKYADTNWLLMTGGFLDNNLRYSTKNNIKMVNAIGPFPTMDVDTSGRRYMVLRSCCHSIRERA